MQALCIGLIGFAGDRTNEAMNECHPFTEAFAQHFGFECQLVGSPVQAKDLPWDVALNESKATFNAAIDWFANTFEHQRQVFLITPRCATAIATLPVVISNYPNVVILYFDAHGDLNTPASSASAYLGGMPITAALGVWDSGYGAGLKPNNLVHIGGRDLEEAEETFIAEHDILTLSKNDIEGKLDDLKNIIANKPVFIHLDTDVFDPSEVTAEYAVANGLFRHHIAKVVDLVLANSQLVGVEITELSPRNDQQRTQSYRSLFDAFRGLSTASYSS